MRRLVRPLQELITGAVAGVFELCLSGSVMDGRVVLQCAHAAPVEAPLPRPPRKRRAGAEAPAPEQSDGSEEELVPEADGVADVDSDSSGFSVDTDVGQELDVEIQKHAAELKAELNERVLEIAAHSLDPAPAPDGELPPEEPAQPRAAPGSWNIWEGLWFYMTQTPGYTDVKMHMRVCFYNNSSTGMGRRSRTKTLTPWHYGDALEDPWRTKLLLRAWALSRARERGWCRAREGRQREARQQSQAICADITRGHDGSPRAPLLGNPAAHRLLETWIPTEVESLLSPG